MQLTPEWQRPLKALLEALEASGEDRLFSPHPFTDDAVAALASRPGKDYYCLVVQGEQVVAYGMLRGWNEGFEIPSLGIAVHPAARRQGLGRIMMCHLHDAARARGAGRVRLRVAERNARAIALYRQLGYRFDAKEDRYLVGYLDLG